MRWAIIILGCAIAAAHCIAEERRESIYHDVEREVDRAAGRVSDDATEQLDRIERSRRPLRPIEQIERDQQRRELLERRQKQATSRWMQIPPSPFDRTEADVVEPRTRTVILSILATVERRELALNQAQQQHADDPAALEESIRAINRRFREELEALLLQQGLAAPAMAPATQPR